MRCRRTVSWLALLGAVAGASGHLAGAGAPGPGNRPAKEQADGPPEALQNYLGTWVYAEDVTAPDGRVATIEHYMLIKWHRGELRVKTVDYSPDRRTWGRESNWDGQIRVDQWNTTKQTFTPLEDGTISVGFSGTNGVGTTTTAAWWAAGKLEWKEDDAGELLHLRTTRGYAPSSKGNAWQPIEYRYRRISREIDRRIERKQGR